MLSESPTALPSWLVLGLALGVLVSMVLAALFYLGDRLFPGPVAADGGRIDGTARRRAEIRDYLREVGEPFAEDHPVGDTPVAFYLPSRGVAITFDAQAYFRLERRGVHAVLCEHEMPGRMLGRRLPFEVPEVDATPYANLSDPVLDAYRRLELPASAGPMEVKSAYRAKVKETHPDRGGDEEAFRRVREAYTTVRNHQEKAS